MASNIWEFPFEINQQLLFLNPAELCPRCGGRQFKVLFGTISRSYLKFDETEETIFQRCEGCNYSPKRIRFSDIDKYKPWELNLRGIRWGLPCPLIGGGGVFLFFGLFIYVLLPFSEPKPLNEVLQWIFFSISLIGIGVSLLTIFMTIWLYNVYMLRRDFKLLAKAIQLYRKIVASASEKLAMREDLDFWDERVRFPGDEE